MKKILFIGDNWFGDLGGRKKIVLSLINFLSKNNYNIQLLTIDTKIKRELIQDFKKDLEKNVQIFSYFFHRNLFFYFKLFILFGMKIFKIRPGLIICFGGGPHSNAVFFYIAKIICPLTKIIFIEQGNTRHLYNKQNFFIKFFTKISFKFVNKIITAGKGVAYDIKNLFNLKDNKVDFVYNFIDVEKIDKMKNELVEEEIFNNKTKPIILTVSRLDLKQKDLLTLIRAFKIIVNKIDSFLVIIGDGPDRNIIENEIKKLDLKNSIFLLGHKNNPYKYMEKSDVFVLSSFHEGLPIVLIEAIACKIPIVATDCDFGPREIIKDNVSGFLLSVGDFKKIAEKILIILTNKNIVSKFVKESLIILKKFEANFAFKKYLKIIEEI